MRGLANRRHQLQKKKRKAKKLFPHLEKPEMFANHLAVCSCYMCGNPRKHWNEETIQEKKYK